MKKSILNIGKTLSKTQQKQITGGRFFCCSEDPSCPPPYYTTSCIIIAGRCMVFPEEGVPC